MRITTGLVFVLVLVSVASGCAYQFVEGPPRSLHPDVYPDCTDSMALPILDAVIGAGGTIGALASSRSSDRDVGAFFFPALYGISALIGYNRVSDCRDARRLYVERHSAPITYTPYTPPNSPYAPPVLAPPHGPVE